MTRPSDVHWSRVPEDAARRAGAVLTALAPLGVRCVLVGGWAVYAYEPRVPSVDVDVYVAPGDGAEARRLLEPLDLRAGPGGEVEILDLSQRVALWGFGDPDLGIPEPGFEPRTLVAGRVENRRVDLVDASVPAHVPTRPALAVTKLAALRNRDLAFRAHREGYAAMLLGPSRANRVRSRDESYYRWKAGKDLFDLGLLLGPPSVAEATRTLLVDQGLAAPARTTVTEVSSAAAEVGQDLAERERVPDPLAIVSRALGQDAWELD